MLVHAGWLIFIVVYLLLYDYSTVYLLLDIWVVVQFGPLIKCASLSVLLSIPSCSCAHISIIYRPMNGSVVCSKSDTYFVSLSSNTGDYNFMSLLF